MFDVQFVSMFNTAGLTVGNFLICILAALVLGTITALVYHFRTDCSRSFMATLATLPAIVALVIMMVGGNLGTGLAVAGTFSLVRFRSMPGTAREIVEVFLSVTLGLACGTGLVLAAVVFAVVIWIFSLLLDITKFGGRKNELLRKTLRITVPEDLDYTGVFDDIFSEFTSSWNMVSVKTTNLGSLNKLTYEITLKNPKSEKEMIDQLRCRNGNLEISLSAQEMNIRDL